MRFPISKTHSYRKHSETDRLDRCPAALGQYSTLSTSTEAVQDDDADADVDITVDDNVPDHYVFRRMCEPQDVWRILVSVCTADQIQCAWRQALMKLAAN